MPPGARSYNDLLVVGQVVDDIHEMELESVVASVAGAANALLDELLHCTARVPLSHSMCSLSPPQWHRSLAPRASRVTVPQPAASTRLQDTAHPWAELR